MRLWLLRLVKVPNWPFEIALISLMKLFSPLSPLHGRGSLCCEFFPLTPCPRPPTPSSVPRCPGAFPSFPILIFIHNFLWPESYFFLRRDWAAAYLGVAVLLAGLDRRKQRDRPTISSRLPSQREVSAGQGQFDGESWEASLGDVGHTSVEQPPPSNDKLPPTFEDDDEGASSEARASCFLIEIF